MGSLSWIRLPDLSSAMALCAFEGWGDAGEGASGALAHVLARSSTDQPIASLDPEEYFDFQQRRPLVEITEGGTRRIHWPKVELYAIPLPDQHRDLVVLLGEEPHYRWRGFCDQLVDAFRRLRVARVLTIGAFVGQVAHTVPVPLVGVSPDPEVVRRHRLLFSGYQGPTGITGVLTSRLVEEGFDVMAIWAAVPHYLANQANPQVMLALVDKAAEVLGVSVDTGDLATEAAEFRHTVDAAVAESEELSSYVKKLESETAADIAPDIGKRLVEEIERYLRSGS